MVRNYWRKKIKLMPDTNEIAPEAKRVLDRLVRAGWLENVRDDPKDPDKGLHWYVDADEPANNGYSRFLAFHRLYSELCRSGPMTTEDLVFFEALVHSVLESNSGGSNHSDSI